MKRRIWKLLCCLLLMLSVPLCGILTASAEHPKKEFVFAMSHCPEPYGFVTSDSLPCAATYTAVLSADTEVLDEKSYNTDYSMRFWALCTYSDGSVQASMSDGIYSIRSATQVATAALADTAIQYESDIVEQLKKIV